MRNQICKESPTEMHYMECDDPKLGIRSTLKCKYCGCVEMIDFG